MAAKMGTKMVALCSAAIGIVYAAGYVVTLPMAAARDNTAYAAGSASIPTQPGSTTAPSKYKNGTYTGRGTNRFGSVQVAVTIKNDQITDVQITECTTHYSQSYIDGLPQEVLANQSAQVDVVSGATRSTQDFQTAVAQALAQAQIQARI